MIDVTLPNVEFELLDSSKHYAPEGEDISSIISETTSGLP
jgi:hypothetical protein